MKGFTLIEILVVIALITMILIATLPAALRFMGSQNLSEVTNTLTASLRQAQSQAQFQKNDSSFGVKFLSSSYVLFQGSSYASRTTSEDTVTVIPVGITVTGISEIVFLKRTGIPNTTGTILVQSGSGNLSILINQQGIIESI